MPKEWILNMSTNRWGLNKASKVGPVSHMLYAPFTSAFITTSQCLQTYKPRSTLLVLSTVPHIEHVCEVYDSSTLITLILTFFTFVLQFAEKLSIWHLVKFLIVG